ncbi:hypothetical protein [Paenibacillus sp. MMS20-IR301]|uniref:hypothetical protein n=1 Tax=Paenibacillus sp. MMS20-IR301 TaxID=2895946 RepID=UPI0028E72898|nr:hypothetical protein [Paenibacillus sp. MMS20-IR301]WNS44356.1 hypothetical protein LOS79_03530 [Paenibacillus sp. MMS20-IR301]
MKDSVAVLLAKYGSDWTRKQDFAAPRTNSCTEVMGVASSDKAVVVLIILAAAIFMVYRIYLWLQGSPRSFMRDKVPINKMIQPHPSTALLEDAGYEIIGGKLKIPLSFQLDGSPVYSRMFIDYVASKDDEHYYLVILSRPRKSLEFTGSGLRDALLPYLLIYPYCSGVLYVDTVHSAVHVIKLGKDDGESG